MTDEFRGGGSHSIKIATAAELFSLAAFGRRPHTGQPSRRNAYQQLRIGTVGICRRTAISHM